MIYFNKLFKLPSPSQLGMSKNDNAMGMRGFGNNQGQLTWEDYYDKLKELYPIRYLFAATLPRFIHYTFLSFIGWKIRDIWWFIKYHTTHRYHFLDLRQPKTMGKDEGDHYRYGYLNSDTRMLYACFNLLNKFVEGEGNRPYCPTLIDVAREPVLNEHREYYREVERLYFYWNVKRKEDQKKLKEMLNVWHESSKADPNNLSSEPLRKEMHQAEEAFEKEEDEMLIRLMKIRRFLWS